jgi:Fic family protein
MDDQKHLYELQKEFCSLYNFNNHKLDKYYDNLDIESTYHSARIHGCEFSFDELNKFLNDGFTTKGRNLFEYIKAQNILDSIKWLKIQSQSNQKFDSKTLKELNHKILNGIGFRIKTIKGLEIREKIVKGDFRRDIKDSNNTLYDNISNKIELMLDDLYYKKNITIGDCSLFYFEFLKIHSFDMANGRMIRLLINYFLNKGNYTSIIFQLEDKITYDNAISKAISGNLEPLNNHIENLLKERYKKMIHIMQTENEV